MSWFSRPSKKAPRIQSQFRSRSSYETPDKWDLDDAFFNALSVWTLAHPKRRLESVLMVVSHAIDQGKDIVEVIPDALFSIRGFIKSVACLFQLGVKIWTAQRDVQDFALGILKWVNGVKESFNQAGEGRFTTMTWQNLSEMRDLIDDICTWAADRLKDKRWSVENLRIKKEIDEFQSRMDEARKLFNDRSLIVVSGSLGAIYQLSQTTLSGQSTIVAALETLKDTLDRQFKQILKEQEERRFVEDKLRTRIADDPSYTTQNKKPCLPGTRHEILDEIKQWIHDDSQDVLQNFLWIVGPPGCGKSAITASIAKYCQSQKNLGGQFFISHANRNTTNPLYYFPTIIRDLYKRSDSVERHLYDALKEHNFSVDTPEKAAQLFLETIQKAASDNPDAPVVVIFDGLDETSSYHDVLDQTRRENLENTAAIFSDLFAQLSHHRNAKIIISSRPETEILRRFKESTHRQHLKQLQIRTDDEHLLQDINIFLEHRLEEIAKRHLRPSLASSWPGSDNLEQLARGASGLFIWAVTACNYIDARLRLCGEEDPDAVFVELKEDRRADLSTLYNRILSFCYPKEAVDEWTFEVFRRIMGSLMVIQEPMNIRDLTSLLDLRRSSNSNCVDIRKFVENLRTLLVPDSGEVTEATVPQAHKSFFDFLTSTSESLPVPFRVNVDTTNAEITFTCLRHIIAAYPDIHATHFASKNSDLQVLSPATIYAVQFALSHMPRQDGESMGVVSNHPDIREISQLGEILRRSSHQNYVGPLAFSVQSSPTFVRTSFENHPLLWNIDDGSVTSPISKSMDNLMQAIMFSPDGSRIFTGESSNLYSLPRHSYDLRRMSFLTASTIPPPMSFTGSKIIMYTFSYDGNDIAVRHGSQVSLHSADSGVLRAKLPQRHQNQESCIHLSQKGSYVASAFDKVVDVWDFRNGCYITEPNVIRHDSEVLDVLLSPDETLLLTCTPEWVHIWEISPCRQLCTLAFERGHGFAFSPDSQLILGGSKGCTVHLLGARTGTQICDPWAAGDGIDENYISEVGFRSCGNIAFTISFPSGVLRVWDVHRASLLMVVRNAHNAVFTPDGSQLMMCGPSQTLRLSGELDTVRGLRIYNLAPVLLDSASTFKPKWTTLSPGGSLVVSAAADQTLCWRLGAIKVVGDPLQGISNFVVAIAFSSDETRIAGASEDGTLYLWDSTTQELLSSLPECAPEASSLSFSPDGAYIEALCANNQSIVVAVAGDELAVSDDEETANAVRQMQPFPKPSYFDTDKPAVIFGTDPAAPNRGLKGVRWYPSPSNSVAWAYIDDHIVRVGQDGSIVVIPVGDAQCR
ncbi:hypothetical protein DXG01_010996 [Tephrocybe rancida]|nr:hypothetical protein DXG01_010996 [Tephrocybe rancida]